MRTNNLPWIIAIAMAVLAVVSWVYNSNTNGGAPKIGTAVVGQSDSDVEDQIAGLNKQIDDLGLAHQGLIEENTALRTLNDNLKVEISETSGEIAQFIQLLDQANIESDEAKSQLQAFLAKVQDSEAIAVAAETSDTGSGQQSSEMAGATETSNTGSSQQSSEMAGATETSDTGSSQQSSESQQLVTQLKRTIANLKEQVQILSTETDDVNVSTTEAESTSGQSTESQSSAADAGSENANDTTEIDDLIAEVMVLTAELEIAGAGADKLLSENSQLSGQVQTLTDDLGTVNERNSDLHTANENSLAQIDALTADNMSLRENIQSLTTELAKSGADIEYLRTRLRYASKHLRRIRSGIRATESDTEALLSGQQARVASLSDELEDTQSQMDRLISDYSAITLESDLVYESGSTRLNERGLAALSNISQQLLNFPGRIVSIEGHTDTKRISASLARIYPTNWELSAARAAAAANYLIDQGVAEESLRVVGYGPLRPVASNDTEDGRAANRRIEIRLVPELSDRSQN
ncbi:MAG: OmpA family protein [Acidiferrobacterales bacterium]|nr:OmpA family protein [Acidiferrobacterales bacterium]